MVDISDFEVDSGHHTHVAHINGDVMFLDIPLEQLEGVVHACIDDDIHLIETIDDDNRIPSIRVRDCPRDNASSYLYVIMGALYNHTSPVAILDDPDDEDGYIVCAPHARVNGEMNDEVVATFDNVCRQQGIEAEVAPSDSMPLTWAITCYKDGVEIDVDVAIGRHGRMALSAMSHDVARTSRVKVSASQARKNAIINSILLSSDTRIQSDIMKAKELVPLVSKDRSRDMSMFITGGRCLHRIFKGHEDGLELWQMMSMDGMASQCASYWDTLGSTSTYYGIRTLQMWAKEDSPEEYEAWNNTSVTVAIERSISATGGDADIATVAYSLNPSLFICDGEEPKEAQFYRFNGTYYQPCGMFHVQDYIEKDVIPAYESYSKDLAKMVNSNPDNNMKDMIQGKMDRCIKIIQNLKKVSYQKSISEILMRRYNVHGFDDIRDGSPYLTAFEDCVLDLSPEMLARARETGDIRACFRDGIPEDYITCSTGYKMKDVLDEYHWDHHHVKDVLDSYDMFETDPEKQVMLRRQIASSLYASNLRKRKVFITGPTNNGKSMLCSWWAKALGPTYFPTNVGSNLLYSMDANPNGPTPSLDSVRFCRVLLQSEITDQHIMNEGLVKRFTGKVDTIASRAMYARKMKSFIPKCTPVTVCNTFPTINGNSSALRTRVLVYKMTSSFISKTDPEWETIKDMSEEERATYMRENKWFFANHEFDQVINRSYKAFMWVMIQDYIKYSIEGIVAPVDLPRSVMQDTVAYFTKSNIYLQFLTQACKVVHGGGGVTTYSMYNAYKRWYMDNVSRFGHVSNAKFMEELAALKIVPVNDMYHNIIITYGG